MTTKLAVTVLLAATAMVATATAAAGQTPAGGSSSESWWVCDTPAPTVYMSAAIDPTPQFEREEMRNAFAQALAAKYGYAGATSCAAAAPKSNLSLEQLKSGREGAAAALRKAGTKVVETGWTYDPSTAQFSYVCAATARSTHAWKPVVALFTKPIVIGAGAGGRLKDAWSWHLKALRDTRLHRTKRCELLPATGAEAAANAFGENWGPDIVVTPVDWDGWNDAMHGEALEQVTAASIGASPQQFICNAWAFPPRRPPTHYWTGLFPSRLSRVELALKWRDRLRSTPRLTGPVLSIHCADYTHSGASAEELEELREAGAKESGAKLVRIGVDGLAAPTR